jgi:[ribosomal protein S18]-alanine N-acetyltransferase
MTSRNNDEQQPETRVRIEPPRGDDLRAVIELLSASGLTPWPPADFERELIASDNVLLVAATEGAAGRQVRGFFAGRVVVDELEIFDVVVAADARRKGVGAALVGAALESARGRGAVRAVLEVRAGNGAAIGLYRRFGFQLSGVRKAYYHNPPEDAWLMTRDDLSGPRAGRDG